MADIPIPDENSRFEIFNVHTKYMPLDKNINIREFAKQSESLSGADIEAICREAGMEAIRDSKKSKKESFNNRILYW